MRTATALTPAPAGMALAEPPVLAVGDSFAYGDEVDDERDVAGAAAAR